MALILLPSTQHILEATHMCWFRTATECVLLWNLNIIYLYFMLLFRSRVDCSLYYII